MSPKEFQQHLVHTMDKERGLKSKGVAVLAEEEIDSLLFQSLPLFPIHQMRDKLEALFAKFPHLSSAARQNLLKIWEDLPSSHESFAGANTLQNIAKGLLCLERGATSSPQNEHLLIAQAARALGFALPEPILFADSNWVRDDFGFAINPGSGKLDFWRFDCIAVTGSPMASWQQWFNGSRKDLTWGVYTRPFEYSS